MSVPLQICNGTDISGIILAHITCLMEAHFCVWCGICVKYLAFGTYPTSTVGALSKDMCWLNWKVFSTKFDEIKGKIFQPIIYVKNQPNKLDWFGSMFCIYMYHTLKGFYQLFEKKLFFNRLLQFA